MRCSEESQQDKRRGEMMKNTIRTSFVGLHEPCFLDCTVPFELNVLVKFFFASFTRSHMPHPFNPAADD